MEIKETHLNDIVILNLSGELDAGTSIFLDEKIEKFIESGYKKFVFGFEQLDYISSAGLGVFISHLDDVNNKDGFFRFFGLQDKIKNVFSLLGFDLLVSIYSSENEALEG
jgi:anti-sigma B factor antagonist